MTAWVLHLVAVYLLTIGILIATSAVLIRGHRHKAWAKDSIPRLLNAPAPVER